MFPDLRRPVHIIFVLAFCAAYCAGFPVTQKTALLSGLNSRRQTALELSRTWEKGPVTDAHSTYLELAGAYAGLSENREASACLREAARLAVALGDLNSAASHLERALRLEQRRKNIDGEAETLAYLAYVHSSLGNFAASEKYLDRTRGLLDKVLDKKALAGVSYHLGETYYAREDVPNFSKYYESALQLFRDVHDEAGEARTLLALSYSYLGKGEVGKGLLSAQEARHKYEALGDVRGRSMSLTALGFLQFKIGEPRNALDSFSLSLDLFSKDLDRSEKGILVYNFGQVHEYFGECDRSIAYYKEALELFKADRNVSLAVGNQWSLGKALNSCGRAEEAAVELKKALKLGIAAKKHHDVIGTYVELAKISEKSGRTDEAEKYYHDALRVLANSDYGWSRSQVYRGLGNLYLTQGRYEKSRPYYLKSLDLDRSTRDRFDEADSLFNLARLFALEGNKEDALEFSQESLRLTESLSSNVVNSKLQGSFVSNVFDRYELQISLLMGLNQDTGDEAYAIRALQTAEKARARSMLESLALSEANILKDASPEDVQKEKELRALLNAKADMLTAILSSNGDAIEANRIEGEIGELRGRIEELKAELKQKSPQYAAIKDPQPFDVAAFQKGVLDDNTLLLEFSLGKTESYLWVVGNKSIDHYVLPSRRRIGSSIEKLRVLLNQQIKPPNEEIDVFQRRLADAEAGFAKESRALSDALLGAAAGKLAGKRLVVVADGKLLYFPLSALPFPHSGSDDPILLSNEVICEPSASALAIIKNNSAPEKVPEKDLLIVSDPVFSITDSRLIRPESAVDQLVSTISGHFRSYETVETLPRLPASADEASAIMDVVGASRTTAISGFAASREGFLNDAVSDYKMFHFATHALVDEMRPELSGIVLSQFDEAGNRKESGLLRLQDVYGMRLNADLVVLSACDTGLGKEIRGEGLMSLNNAFLQAGARSVVSSLWKVEDAVAKELMTEFYSGIASEGLTASEALRRAKIKVRNDPRFRSPFYWASFTLQGNFDTAPKFSRPGYTVWVGILSVVPFLICGAYWIWQARKRRSGVSNYSTASE